MAWQSIPSKNPGDPVTAEQWNAIGGNFAQLAAETDSNRLLVGGPSGPQFVSQYGLDLVDVSSADVTINALARIHTIIAEGAFGFTYSTTRKIDIPAPGAVLVGTIVACRLNNTDGVNGKQIQLRSGGVVLLHYDDTAVQRAFINIGTNWISL